MEAYGAVGILHNNIPVRVVHYYQKLDTYSRLGAQQFQQSSVFQQDGARLQITLTARSLLDELIRKYCIERYIPSGCPEGSQNKASLTFTSGDL